MKSILKLSIFFVTLLVASCWAMTCFAAPIISDGSDGPFNPTGPLFNVDLPADGIFNFTTINIPEGVTVKFNRNVANTPVYFAATGDVTINGVIDVSATATDVVLPPVPENPKQSDGPGVFNGGYGGTGASSVGDNGGCPGGGGGGYGGGLSTQLYSSNPAAYSSGADGGMGYVMIHAEHMDIQGTVDAVMII